MRGLDRAALLDAAQHGEECGGGDSAYWFVADPGEDVAFEPAENLVTVGGDPRGGELGKPFARYGFEAVRLATGELRGLLMGARVDAVRKQPSGVVALLTGASEEVPG